MRTIYKYRLSIIDESTIDVPCVRKILSVGLDPQGDPCIWVLVDSESELKPMHVAVVGTGNAIPNDVRLGDFIGSILDRVFVWHVFAR